VAGVAGREGEVRRGWTQGVVVTVCQLQSECADYFNSNQSFTSHSSESTSKKAKGKAQRKWGDSAPSETEMASLDFSTDKPDSGPNGHLSHDLQALVDKASLGTRTRDGLYEVKDWDFGPGGKDDETKDAITRALKNEGAKQSSGSLGALSSLFSGASAGPNHRRQSFISRWRTSTDVESAIKSPTPERPPIPNALRGSESDPTPLPALSMIVLSIVSLCTHLRDMTDQVPRLCLESFFPPTSPCRFSFSWSKVRNHMWHSCCLTNELGFRIWRDQ
jgi:hypothetical protein